MNLQLTWIQNLQQMLDLMAKLNQEEHITFIFSTHDTRVIERARRIITLVDGKIHSDTATVETNVPHHNTPLKM